MSKSSDVPKSRIGSNVPMVEGNNTAKLVILYKSWYF